MKKNKFLTVVAILAYILAGMYSVFADTWTLYDKTTTNNGIQSNSIRDVRKESSGTLWVATNGGGISKFDGQDWTYYKTGEGLANNNAWDIAFHPTTGDKWIATGNGVSQFDGTDFTNYDNTNSGLSTDDCRAIAVDQNGDVWIGTYGGGLFKFDGSNWTNYNTSNSDIPHNRVWDIDVASDNSLWLATFGGAAHFDGTNWDVYVSQLASDDVYALDIASNGDVWFASLKGINKFDGSSWSEWDEGDGLSEQSLRAIAVGPDGIVWVGTYGGGADSFDGSNFTNYNETNSEIADNNVWAVYTEEAEKIWFGCGTTGGGVNLLEIGAEPPVADFSGSPTSGEEPLTVNFYDQSTGDVTSWDWDFGDGGSSTAQNPSYEYSNDGTYTVSLTVTGPVGSDTKTKTNYITVNPSGMPNCGFTGTPTSGLYPLTVNFTDQSTGNINSWDWTFGDGGTSTAQNPSYTYDDPGDYTVSLTVDGPVGSDSETKTNYINVWSELPDEWTTYDKASTGGGINNNNIRAITPEGSDLWVGTSGGGMSKFDGTDWTLYKTGEGLINNYVWGIDIDPSGNKWISTNGGVSKFDGTNFTNYTKNQGMSSNAGRGIAVDNDGTTIWVGTNGGGLNKFDGSAWTYYNKGNSNIPNNYVKDVAVDAQGNVWLATLGGAVKFDGTNWTTWTSELPNDDVWGVNIDADGNKWFATIRGLAKYDGSSWTVYEEENGMAEENSRDMCVDDNGILWVATVSVGGGHEFDGSTWTQYKTTNSGIANNYVWVVHAETPSKIWFGTNGGVSLFLKSGGGPGAPVAAFSGTPLSGEAPLTVNFTDESTGDITDWSWNFGEGGTSTEQNPSHEYLYGGDYTVSLTVTGPGGDDTETKTAYISVTEPPQPPTPNFTADVTSGLAPLTVNFTDLSSGCIDTWKYDFDGDDGDDWSDSHTGNTSWTYDSAGVYSVRLKVRDCNTSQYYSETKVNYITVTAPIPPSVAFSALPTSGSEPQTVSFFDETTGDLAGWDWDFGDGNTSTEQNPNNVYNQGTYTVKLVVTGPGGVDSLTKVDYITIGPPEPPVANFGASPLAGYSPLEVNFVDSSGGSVTAWDWDFGDGGNSTEKNPTHSYSPGTYTVSLVVSGPLGSDSLTKADYIIVNQAPPGGTGLVFIDSPDDLTNTHPHLWVRGYGPDNGMWQKAQTTHSSVWQRLSDTAPTGSWGGISRTNGQQLMRAAMAFVISKDPDFGNHCQDAILSLNGYSFSNQIDNLECFYGYCLAFDALADDQETQWLTQAQRDAAIQTMADKLPSLNLSPGATWRVRPTHNLMVLRAAAQACATYNIRGESGYEALFDSSRQFCLTYHMERVNGLCDNSVLERNGPRPLDGFPYEGPNYGAYQASRALVHRHVLEVNEYPNPETVLDENKSGFFQNYNLGWMAVMLPGLDEWADVAYRGKHGMMQGVRFYSAVNKAIGNGVMAGVGEWFHQTLMNSASNVGDGPDHGWWQGWEFVWYDPSIQSITPEEAGIPYYVHLDDAEYHVYRTSWAGAEATSDDVYIYFRNSGHDSHNQWDEGHTGDGIPYECVSQTGSHDGPDNGHFGIYRNTSWIAENESPQGETNMHNCLLIDGTGQLMDGQRGYEVPELAGTDVLGAVDSDYGHALDADVGPAYGQVSNYHRYFFVIRDPMYAIVVDELEAGHTIDFQCYAEQGASKQAEDLYTSNNARYEVLYPSSGYTSSAGVAPITINTTSTDLMFLVHPLPSGVSFSKSFSGGIVTANIGSDEVVYNASGGSYDNGTISGNAKFFAERSGGALVFKANNATGSEYGISCDADVNMSVKGTKACIYVYGSGTQTVTITSYKGTDVFDVPAGQTIIRTLTGTSADPPVADFTAMPRQGWNQYFAPEFISLSTGWITDYYWEFGDGAYSTEMAPHHKYNLAGLYTVKLTVSGPGGVNTKIKENFIYVNDFASDYNFPDYIINTPSQTEFDNALDAIEASQTPGLAPGDPTWCGPDWCQYVQHGGGGRILFNFSNDTIFIDWAGRPNGKRDFFGDNLIIDGEDKNVAFYYSGSQGCDQTENQCAFRIHGNDNVVRNISFDRFPDGLHMRGGQRNLLENITINIVCEDANTFNGSGNHCMECVARGCTYGSSVDKTFMVGGGGSQFSAVINDMHSTNGNQPIRMTGGGFLVVRNSNFLGEGSQGPRFGGESNIVIFENNYSTSRNGIRVSDKANVLIRNNTMETCEDYGIYSFNDGYMLRAQENTITNCGMGSVLAEEKGYADLGGGLLDIFRDAEHWLPAAEYPTTEPVASLGRNTFYRTGVDVTNNTYEVTPGDLTMSAENNFWDNSTVSSVLANDVSGDVDVDPLGVPLGKALGPVEIRELEITDDIVVPDKYSLAVYPNPFNPETNVNFALPHKSDIVVEVYDILGRRVKILFIGKKSAGRYQIVWRGRNNNGLSVGSGVYFIQLRAKGMEKVDRISMVKKVLFLK